MGNPEEYAQESKLGKADASSTLPAYSASADNQDQPPAYTPPSSFSIGGQVLTTPLVTIEQLKAHLSLLRAFKQLRSVIDEGADPRIPEYARALDPIPRWGWFVNLAVDR